MQRDPHTQQKIKYTPFSLFLIKNVAKYTPLDGVRNLTILSNDSLNKYIK